MAHSNEESFAYTSEEHNFAEVVRPGIRRLDMPDGRTRLHSVTGYEPGDIRGDYGYDIHRVIDRDHRVLVLDLWRVDCSSEAEWRDGALDLLIQPGDLRLRIDLARGEYCRSGDDAFWLPIDNIQAHVEREIGTGFGFAIEADCREAEYKAGAPERAEAARRQCRKDIRALILYALFFLAMFLLWYLDPTGAQNQQS